jgi:RNA methyltransferase, TrmH family
MISNNQSKFIKSLHLKKSRREQNCFFVEGRINVLEALRSDYRVNAVFVCEEFEHEVSSIISKDTTFDLIKETELQKIGTYQSNNFGIAILESSDKEVAYDPNQWSLALDGISDPGNLGTIVRTADWFGIKTIYCSPESVDFYNPKVINATKGSFARVNVQYVDLSQFLKEKVVISAEMSGKNLYQFNWPSGGVILMGNESHGVSEALSLMSSNKITIPKMGKAESLNVAIATSVICAELRRLSLT